MELIQERINYDEFNWSVNLGCTNSCSLNKKCGPFNERWFCRKLPYILEHQKGLRSFLFCNILKFNQLIFFESQRIL